MAGRIRHNKKNRSAVIVFTATGTCNVAGNSSVSEIAYNGPLGTGNANTSDSADIDGAVINQVVWGTDGTGYWTLKRGANTVGVYSHSGSINYAALGIPITDWANANISVTLSGGTGIIEIEVKKQGQFPSGY